MYSRSNCKWTEEEDTILLERYGRCDIETLSASLRRSQRAIYDRLLKIEGTHSTSSISGNFKTTDVAEIMGVSLVTIHNWIKKKEIPYTKTKSHYLIIESSFWKWLENNLNRVNFIKIDDSIEFIVPEWYRNEIKNNKKNYSKAIQGRQNLWTEHEETLAWNMFLKGLKDKEIALKLGRTTYSVNHKLRLLRKNKMKKAS